MRHIPKTDFATLARLTTARNEYLTVRREDEARHLSRLCAQRHIVRRTYAAERDAKVLDLERRSLRWRERHFGIGNGAEVAPPRGQAREEAQDAALTHPAGAGRLPPCRSSTSIA